MKIKPQHSRFVSLGVALVFALPMSFGWLTGIFLWTSPLLLLNLLLSGQTLSLLSLLGVIILILSGLHRRWYCKWICPTGILCDFASKKSKLTLMDCMPRLGVFIAALVLVAALMKAPLLGMLDPIAIFHSFFNGFREESFLLRLISMSGLVLIIVINLLSRHIWCNSLCPLGGLQDAVFAVKKLLMKKSNKSASIDVGRRAAIGAIGGFALALLIKKSVRASSIIRPPAALPEAEFQSTCIRCGNCVKACPTGIIHSSFDPTSITDLLTPRIVFDAGYCLPECTTCGKVCPSGAIQRFSIKDKKSLIMGIARIKIEGCLLSQQRECDRCQHYCDYQAITIRTSDVDYSAWPEVDEDRCVGCGACVVACPVSVIDIEKKAV